MKNLLGLLIPGLLVLASGCGGASSASGQPPSSGATPGPGPGATSPSSVQLSNDPFTDTTAQHQTAVEPSTLAVANTIVSAFQVGRITTGASDAIGWASSTDGGNHWTRGFVPGLTTFSGGTAVNTTDAVVAYDAVHGVWMIETLIFPTTGAASSVVVNRSNDGLNWSQPVTIASGNYDKNWITCDNGASSPHRGTCYSEWDDSQTAEIFFSTSTDGGSTWSSPQGTADSATGIGGQFAIQPNGNVVVPFYNGSTSSPQILAASSTDGGQSWSSSAVIATPQTTTIPVRGETDPQVAVAPNGTIDLAWFDCRFETGCSANDVAMLSSSDGTTWSGVTRLAIDAIGSGTNHFLPTIAVNPATSNLALMYYTALAGCSGTSCALTPMFSHSVDGGSTWSAPSALWTAFPASSIADTTEGRMLGDYLSIGFVGSTAFPVFSAVLPLSGAEFNQQIFTIPLPGV